MFPPPRFPGTLTSKHIRSDAYGDGAFRSNSFASGQGAHDDLAAAHGIFQLVDMSGSSIVTVSPGRLQKILVSCGRARELFTFRRSQLLHGASPFP